MIVMAHLIEIIYRTTVAEAITLLEKTHGSIMSCVINDQTKGRL